MNNYVLYKINPECETLYFRGNNQWSWTIQIGKATWFKSKAEAEAKRDEIYARYPEWTNTINVSPVVAKR